MNGTSTPFPLTLPQQDIYFDQLHAPRSPRYNIGGYIRFGAIDVARLQHAHARMVETHDAFGIRVDAARAEQWISAERTTALPLVEAGDVDGWLRERFATLIPLDGRELFRAALLKVSENEYRYVVVAHHLMIDGWGFSNLARVLGELYDGGSADASSESWPELAAADAEYAQGARYAESARHWGEHCTPLPEAPLRAFHAARFDDRERVPSGRATLVLSRAEYERHLAAANAMGVGIQAYFMAVVAAYFAKTSGQDRLILGVPSHNRRTHQQKRTIGAFIGINPLSIDVARGETFAALAARIQNAQKKNYRHARYPLGHIVRELGLRDRRLYDVGFNYLKLDSRQAADIFYLSHGFEPTPLSITLFENGDAQPVELQFDFRRDYFDDAEAARLAARFASMLEAVRGDVNVGALDVLSAADRDLIAAAATCEGSFPDAGIPALVEAHAKRTPDAIVVVRDGETLTYRELNARANAVAHFLIDNGVDAGALVGIRTERSLDGIAALLGILKTGAAYLPLDRNLPEARLRYLMEDSGVRVVLTDETIAGIDRTRTDNPSRAVLASDVAYVMYTSGSTGQPKGVMVEHRGVVRLVVNADYAPFDASTRMLHVSSAGFDASTWEIWGALLNGGTLVLYPETLVDLAVLNATIDAHAVNTMLLTAALFDQWSHQLPRANTLRFVFSGGDVVSPAAAARIHAALPDVTLINAYGPTENSVITCCHTIARGFDVTRAIPLGRRIHGTSVHVLDANGEPLPAGAAGELYAGGAGLARGYWNRPELTAEKFVTIRGERLYRTGDLVRFLPDGTLAFIGRADEQVKVRGFRIEPGEVEAHLLRIDGVREAAVAVKGEGSAKFLVAYFVGDAEDVLAALRQSLPEHMIPSAVVRMDALPLNVSGKVDRKALPDPELRAAVYEAPANEAEARIAAVWSEVLGIEQVSVTASFFDLGGHSLLATRIAAALGMPVRSVFEHPTVRALAGVAQDPARDVSLMRRTDAGPTLSFAQQRLWFIDQLEQGSAQYNIPAALSLRGTLDVAALQRAFDALVARHEVLRTRYVPQGATCTLEVDPVASVPMPVVDATRAELERLVREEATRPFDLARELMLRTTLVRLAKEEHVLLLTLHHIAADGLSMNVLVREVSALYAGQPLPPLALQYADYAQWQRDELQGDVFDAQVAYWKEQLADAPPVHSLPLDKPRPAQQRFEGGTLVRVLDGEVTAKLQALAQEHRASLFMVLQSAFALLVGRWSRSTDLVIGTPVAGRERAELDALIGCFVNTVVLRTQLAEGMTFAELLDDTRRTALDAYAHQRIPFDILVDELRTERSLAHAPLFQLMFTHHEDVPLPRFAGVETSLATEELPLTKFDLNLTAIEETGAVRLRWDYAASLFERATVERLAASFDVLVRAIAAAPHAPVMELPLTNAVARVDELAPVTATIHEIFEQRAVSTPDAVALVSDDVSWTYAELNARANQLAHALLTRGVRAGELVAIRTGRSPEGIAGVLAILKAGAAYLPLDPAYPEDRTRYMLEDAGVRFLLTETALLEDAPLDLVQAVLVDSPAFVAAQPATNPSRPASRDDLAYVIYTSGSTGQPKGVMVEHRGVVRLVIDTNYVPLDAGTRILQAASPAFDAATFEIWGALLNGGQLVLYPDTILDLDVLNAQLERHAVNTLWLTAGLFEQWSHRLPKNGALRWILAGGDVVSPAAVARVYRAMPRVAVINGYGPTENTTFTCCYTIPRDADFAQPIPLGTAIRGTTARVLDDTGHPLPDGAIGELYAGGAGLARGYWNDVARTAEKFVTVGGERLYKTGDLVRVLPDGNLAFIGRIDEQVKIRGFRIEPGEIETQLLRIDGVSEAVVVVKGEGAGKFLAAYVVTDADPDLVREELRRALPDYMIPSAFVRMETLPLNANGKVDRKALPEPERQTQRAYAAPSTESESRIAAIWQEILRLDQPVSATANFFELGGDSLLAMRITSAIGDAFGKTLAVRALFEHNTLRALAAYVDRLPANVAAAIPAVPRHEPLPLSFAQQRLWFIDQLEQGSAQYNMPAALRLRGALDAEALQRAFDAIVARHEVLRTTFSAEGQTIHPAAPFEIVRLDVTEAEVERLVREEAARPFDLSRDRMLRATLLRIREDEHVLLCTMHHIASDAWSIDILVDEIAALYAGQSLAPLPIQYADYAVWQRTQPLDEHLAYWKAQLADLPAVHSLPLDRPRPAQQRFDGGFFTRTLDAAQLEKLHALAQTHNASLFMLLQSAFALLLGRWSRSTDVVVGTPIAGREHRDLDPLIGFFVNTLVLRTHLSETDTFATLLERAKQTALDAYAHQAAPFEMLVDELRPERSLSHGALFQILFSLLPHEPGVLDLPGLEVETLGQDFNLTKFDLNLTATESKDGLQLRWQYATSLFERETIERMADAFAVLLDGIAAVPETPVYALPLLDESAKASLLAQSCGPVVVEGRDLPVHRLFEQQAAKTPDAIAAGALTYRELNERANRLANWIAANTTNARIGLQFERSPEVLVAMLGILKAGRAYVPFEPSNTAARLRHVIENAGITCVVDAALLRETETCSAENPSIDVPLDASAYVIYTSGSTGTPKGVEITHAGLIDYLAYASERYYAAHLQGSLVVTSHGFDITVPSLYVPLFRGGRVDFTTPGEELTELAQALSDDRNAYLLRMTPMHLTGALALAANRPPSTANHVFVIGGEAFPATLARELQSRFPNAQIYNHYGPSETVVGCAMFDVTANLHVDRLPIGSPMANTQLFVLNEAMQLAPVGVAGELHIGGAGVARGYVNQPELTAAKFVAFGNNRVYKSGDLVRWLPAGDLEFLGRADDQVKIRGFRIEPGEIESVIKTEDGVKDALVVAHGEGEHKALAAYVIGDAALQTSLVARLQQSLPDYMMPAGWCFLDAFPLNANGKIDRRKLPAIERQAANEYVAPATATEEKLAEIWRELLKLDQPVSVTASFFALGGHSLLATRVVSAISATFDRAVPVRALFEHNSVRALAAHLDAQVQTAHVAIPRVPRGGELPLSFAQQRLWFVDQLTGASPQYNMPAAFRLRGRLDRGAFQRTLDEIVRRHEIVRTNYVAHLGDAKQVIRDAAPVTIREFDLRSLDADTREARMRELARAEAARPFDLKSDLMFRVALLTLADDETLVLFTMHHIASDGWSVGVLVREFVALYAAFASGNESPLAPLPVQYADFAQWQRDWLEGDRVTSQLAYWRTQLDGIPQAHSLPLDKIRPAAQSFVGDRFVQNADPELLRALNDLARRNGATLYMVLQSALALLVGRWSNERDVVIGNTIAGRTHQDVEGLIGFFVNTIPLRTDLAAAATFDELLAQVRRTSLEAHANQDVPFEMLVDELKVERTLSHSPLVQLVFTFRNNEQAEVVLPELVIEPESETSQTSRFDLELLATENEEGLELAWGYSTDIFERATIEAFGASFEALLRNIVAAPDASLRALNIVTEDDRARREAWQREEAPWPEELCIQELFEQRAAETPDAIAVVLNDENLTYGELNAAANRLAHYLVTKDVKPDTCVAICVERSLDMLVGMLGILKAGGAYLPIDPAYPEERMAHMLEDAGVRLVLTQSEVMQLQSCLSEYPTLPIDAGFREALLARFPDTNLDRAALGLTSRHLAYVIYTSGSTGKPKGTMVEHRGVVRLVINNHYVPLSAETRMLQLSTCAFDAATFEVWGALLNGGTLILYPESLIDLGTINEQIESQRANTCFITTGLFEQWSHRLPKPGFMKYVLTGGEVMNPAAVGRVHDALPDITVSNMYGPTENTTFTTAGVVPRGFDRTQPVSLGHAINGTTLHILDAAGLELPAGAVGELWCGGPGVARGYLKRPELTAEKFVNGMYRTGDLVRALPDGALMFVGRVDNQVKIRGFRIEPGEIEAQLLRIGGVREAVVLVKGERTERYLAAYVVTDADLDELRKALKQVLPDYMVPGAFVRMESLPLNASGKVDTKALPDPERQSAGEYYVAPGTDTEQRIAEIWREILKLDRPVSANAHFFDLGGNSLSLLRVKAHIEKSLEVEVPTRYFFDHPTVSGLALATDLLRSKNAAETEELEEMEVGEL